MSESYTREEIMRLTDEWDVKFVRLQFTDILGIIKNVAITVEELESALDGEIMFDGSSIEGFTRIQESDMYLMPDFDTFAIFPWHPQKSSVARLICDVYTPDGQPFVGDPRSTLRKVLAEANEMGYTLYSGPEPEFYLFKLDQDGRPTTEPNDEGGYFDLSPIDLGNNTRRDIVLSLEEMGFEVEASHHEVGPGQHEIDFKYTDALTTADNIATFRFVTKAIAKEHGYHATFMPKPIHREAGSGMHTHLSLFKNGKNAFYDPDDSLGLSQTAYHFIGGILKHAKAITAITNPTINSYKRLVPGFEAPVYISWSGANRSALIRIPSARGEASRVELRNPDPSCNPYLALTVILKAGLDGIRNEIEPGPQALDNIYQMSAKERRRAGIENLPADINEAVEELSKDKLLKEALGQHIYSHFVEAKNIEWKIYRTQVHQWELEQYLRMY